MKIDLEWLDGTGVTDAALRRTWCRFVVRDSTGQAVSSNAEYGSSATIREGVYGSILPLTEWLIRGWYPLLYGRRLPTTPMDRRWRAKHRWRAGREGMPFPDLFTYPDSDHVLFEVRPQPAFTEFEPLRFIDSAQWDLTVPEAERAFTELLDRFEERLRGERDARSAEWLIARESLRSLDARTRRWRIATARLDVAADTPETDSERRLIAAEWNPVLDSLLDVVDRTDLPEAVRLAESVWSDCDRAETASTAWLRARIDVDPGAESASSEPWRVGWRRAKNARASIPSLATRSSSRDSLRTIVSSAIGVRHSTLSISSERPIGADGAVAWRAGRTPSLFAPRGLSARAAEFRTARELHGLLFEGRPDRDFARVYGDRSRASLAIANAFAAEILVPRDELADALRGMGIVTRDDIGRLAKRWNAPSRVIVHQIENHGLATLGAWSSGW